MDLTTPPGSPAAGQCWIVAASASGDWAGMEGALAGWTDNGWRFAIPAAGWRVWVTDRSQAVRFDGSVWTDEEARADGYFVAGDRVLAGRQTAVTNPAGGAVVDAEARAAILAVLVALRTHGLIAT